VLRFGRSIRWSGGEGFEGRAESLSELVSWDDVAWESGNMGERADSQNGGIGTKLRE